eukprot:m.263132 g.263132  ORF g.263132 m.263132 type:complete len:579 (-) comp15598_c1_seq3:367-2103(-)
MDCVPSVSEDRQVGPFDVGSIVLGQGSFGRYATIKAAQHTTLRTKVACRVINKRVATEPASRHRILQGVNSLKQLSHPHILQFLWLNETEHKVYVFLESADTSLLQLIRGSGALSNERTMQYTAQLMQATHYLHTQNMVHRNIKLDHILVVDETTVKLTGFGFAGPITRPLPTTGPLVLDSPHYTSPEYCLNVSTTTYNETKCDVWSLGVVVYAMVEGRLPFLSTDLYDLFGQIIRSHFPTPQHATSPLSRLIAACLQPKPALRPRPHALLRMYLSMCECCADHLSCKKATVEEPMAAQQPHQRQNKTTDNVRLRALESLKDMGYSQEQMTKDLKAPYSSLRATYNTLKYMVSKADRMHTAVVPDIGAAVVHQSASASVESIAKVAQEACEGSVAFAVPASNSGVHGNSCVQAHAEECDAVSSSSPTASTYQSSSSTSWPTSMTAVQFVPSPTMGTVDQQGTNCDDFSSESVFEIRTCSVEVEPSSQSQSTTQAQEVAASTAKFFRPIAAVASTSASTSSTSRLPCCAPSRPIPWHHRGGKRFPPATHLVCQPQSQAHIESETASGLLLCKRAKTATC